MPTIDVNRTALYYEIRGAGPPVLLIMGATGDGGHFDALADWLADEFMVVSYDRRGNGRSPVPDAVPAPVRASIQKAMEVGGPPAAVERFWCYVAGDDGWARLAPALRERLCDTASTLFGVELGTYELYMPDDETLAAVTVPVRLLVSGDSLPVFAQMAIRLGKRLGVDVATVPGTHATYHEHPHELAEAMRPFLREVSGMSHPSR